MLSLKDRLNARKSGHTTTQTAEQTALERAVQKLIANSPSRTGIAGQAVGYFRLIPSTDIPQFVQMARNLLTTYDEELAGLRAAESQEPLNV